jgi:SAM-dependent methyltransferase
MENGLGWFVHKILLIGRSNKSNMLDLYKRIKGIFTSKPVNSGISFSGVFQCTVCNSTGVGMNPLPIYYFKELHKYQYIHNIFFTETINFEHYSCENCGAADRDRLYALYLKEFLKKNEIISILDIAPALSLSNFLKAFENVNYRSMDISMLGVDDHLDITNMYKYNDNQFDYYLCSHVLEHIPDDLKAMQELYRILKPGGKGITMVPINLELKETMEDPTKTSIGDRWKYFGQDDHVRQYAKTDFINRLKSVGFKVELFDITYFGEETFKKNAIYPTSVLYVVSK